MKALDGWFDALPSYAAPEITPEGDIIIRRLDRDRPRPPDAPPPESPPPESPSAAPDGSLRL